MNNNVLFIANIELNKNEGIFKKVFAQANALKNANEKGWLITRYKKNGSKIYNLQLDNEKIMAENIFKLSMKLIENENIKMVYIRHMIPSFKLLDFLIWLKRKKIYIIYEIPTYPYFAEQFRTARKKYRALIKIFLDILFAVPIYKCVNRIAIIKSNTKVKKYSKMIEINNGVDISQLSIKKYDIKESDRIFRMVAVGTIYPYHGYDRMLEGLANCKEKVEDTIIEFHIVGESYTIENLKKKAENLGLKHVVFHGMKTTEELNELYQNFDIGVGCLALFRRNANIDTTLKIIEYYCRGIPVITSGISPMDEFNPEYTIHIPNDNSLIDIIYIYNEFTKMKKENLNEIALIARDKFSWDSIIKRLSN